MMKYYDKKHKRLLLFDKEATPEFWDHLWDGKVVSREALLSIKETFVSRITRKYLAPDAGSILEGGCGWGKHLVSLTKAGYRCVGLDFAPKTLAAVRQALPEYALIEGDVRALPCDDAEYVAYWSVGVIEHFPEGYDTIADEMYRVLKPDGFLFCAFPVMSPLRKCRALLRTYRPWRGGEYNGFYQFVLSADQVCREFEKRGFVLRGSHVTSGFKGLVDECPLVKRLLKGLYYYQGPRVLVGYIRKFIDMVLVPLSGHLRILVFQKMGDA